MLGYVQEYVEQCDFFSVEFVFIKWERSHNLVEKNGNDLFTHRKTHWPTSSLTFSGSVPTFRSYLMS